LDSTYLIKLTVAVLYGALITVNEYGFNKVKEAKPDSWYNYELNPVVRRLMKKTNSSYPTMLFNAAILEVLLGLCSDELMLGIFLGFILFNLLHDYHSINEVLRRLEVDGEK